MALICPTGEAKYFCKWGWGLSSIKPDDGRSQMDCGEEISGGFVVARGDSSKLLELAEEVLNEMTRLESRFVIGALGFAIVPGWNHGGFASRAKRLDHTLIGVECFVCQQSVGLHVRQQRIGAFQIMCLARGQKEGEWIAQGVDQGVNFGAQPAVAGPDRLGLTVFFWAPALCWCARTVVLSIMAYSLSASAASISNTFFHTPFVAQRENRI
jgi:hypothetical protein